MRRLCASINSWACYDVCEARPAPRMLRGFPEVSSSPRLRTRGGEVHSMPVPPLVNGVLPSGTYSATFAEVEAAFDQPGSSTRPTLTQALQHAAILIWSRDASAIVYVNGSYITEKPNPLDLDLAVRSDVWDDTAFLAAFSVAYPTEVALIDVFFNTTGSAQHMEDLFREIQDKSARKGIIRLLP